MTATFNRVELYDNDIGLNVNPFNNTVSTRVTVTDSVAAGNFIGFEIVAPGSAAAASTLTVVRSVVANNVGIGSGTGLVADGANATVRLGQSTVTGNDIGWRATGGALLQSFGDNYIAGNGDNDPAPPTIARK